MKEEVKKYRRGENEMERGIAIFCILLGYVWQIKE
jgi:hypothetical protein